MKLIWSRESRNDIRRLYHFLAGKSPQTARRAVDSIKEKASQLSQFPDIGKPMNDGSSRKQLYVRFGAYGYVIRYRIQYQVEEVRILRIWHVKEKR